ncbi:MAG: hypothetical protein J6V45_01435, partial [Kiritimatiellae bacterium]|nr:hypothetical protein [Kiritimatiellia bacterium]
DPKADRNNKIYSSDAWTPTRGSVNIEYKVLDEKLDEIIASLINAGDENYRKLFKAFSERGSLGDIAENAIAAGEYYRLWHNDAILLSYLHSKGQSVPLSYREQAVSHNYSNAVVKGVSDAVGDKIAEIWENGGKTGDEEAVERMSEIMRPAAVKAKDDENPEGAAERRATGVPTLGERLYGAALKRPWDLAKAVMQYRERGITEEIDTFAVSKTMSEMLSTDDPAYQEWVRSTFAPAVGAEGIRNKRELFTPSGSRRSWEALHDEVTAQRIVDMMYHNSKEVGGNGFGGYNPEGAAVRTYASITEMRRDRDRLKVMPEEEWKKLHDEARKDMIDAVSRLQSKQKGFYSDNSFIELDTIKDIVLQAWIDAKGNKAKYLSICKDELHVYDEETCSDIWDVMMRLRNAPTKYFEAKPERVVGFDEVAFAVIPDDSSAETVDILKTRGIETHTYKAEDKEDRLRVLNEAANANNLRFSIGGIYTGSAADYEKPSLHYVGSGEGSQVYGWGLYGSTVRGVAEGYAERDVQDKKFEGNNIIFKGKRVDFEESDKWPEDQKLALLALSKQEGDVFSAKLTLKKGIFGNNILDRSKADRALAWLERNESDIEKARPNLYEQTFFTDRAPGDESHLLKWYEPVSEEQLDWITAQAEKEGLVNKFENNKRWLNFKGSFKEYIFDNGSSADAVYEQLSNSGIAHSDNKYRDTSEFLARAGIDGVKYPVDSYGGKGVKDGDTAGWNYVSFRDDNIRVDHKWVDGEQRFSIVTLGKYRTDDLRSLAHRVKDGDAEAIAEAGRRLAVIMPPDAILVPMPSHTGEPTTMRLLADAIAANANGAKVVDALRSNAHESNYAQKKRGEEPAEIEMRKVADIPENAEVYIVDNVIDTGATYSAAMKAIPNAHILALADTDRTPREMLSMTRSIAEIDAQDGTNLQGIGELVAEVKERGEKPRGKQGHFNLSKTPEFLKNILSGEYFTVKAGVILDHFGKDPDHSLTI